MHVYFRFAAVTMVQGSNPNSVPDYFRDTLLPLIQSADNKNVIVWLQRRSLLQRRCVCVCGSTMSLIKRKGYSDGYAW